MKNKILEKLKILAEFLSEYRLLVFFAGAIVYLELVYRLWSFKTISFDFVFPVLFSLSAGAVLYLFSNLFSPKVNRIVSIALTSLLILVFGIQIIYYCVFHTPFSFYSLAGAEDVLQFGNIIITTILKNVIAVILLFVPLALLLIYGGKFLFCRKKTLSLYFILFFFIGSYIVSMICVNLTGRSNISQYSLYYKNFSPELSVNKLGLLTTMRLDLERLIFGFEQNNAEAFYSENTDDKNNIAGDKNTTADDNITADGNNSTAGGNISTADVNNSTATSNSGIAAGTSVSPDTTDTAKTGMDASVSGPSRAIITPSKEYNVMNIDFESLIAGEKDKTLLGMHKYFSSVKPSKTNEYTGLFKGDNLILITAEAFSPYAISPELTPTLYKMSTEGFVFKNFYNPVWSVSTSDGEYVACTGLMPKAGVWSFARSGRNYMPFVMGNQFKKLGYGVKAYHDHTYTYYKRNISHPNMGYDYKGVGNGLQVKKTWPESDLEMIEVTSGEYIGSQPFHTYYMTVSGHLQYNFSGNYIAKKNKALVADLPLSNSSKAYIACNLELEFAMKALIDKLEAAGIADKTVIAISPDHYPYGLPRECIDELAGHKVENNFELYKSKFILWKKGMDPVIIDEPCSSLDINPTLSNLFGLEYDSRLLMGSDILSDTPPLVIFSNWSWMTDRAMYNTAANTLTFTDGTEKDTEYVKAINKTVADKFKYSEKILDTDYYSKVINH